MEYVIAVIAVQVVLSVCIGLYCVKVARSGKDGEPEKERKGSDGGREMEKLRRMRAISLAKPLNEQIRPSSFDEIVGQQEGIRALKALLCCKNPQHVLIYGPPGVGKTCAARLVLEEAKKMGMGFGQDAPFVEMDATCVRFDERAIADPLIGSVHDPIYQGAGMLGQAGVPQPKPGAVTRAHGGILFLDEIGELHPVQMNKLLKVLEDRRVMLESAYYSETDKNTPPHIHDIFRNGLPADFRLVGATTRSPQDIPIAIRSRCMEVFFRPLTREETALIARNAAKKAGYAMEEGCDECIGAHAEGGRDAANIVQVAVGIASSAGRNTITREDVDWVIRLGSYAPRQERAVLGSNAVGCVNALAVHGNVGAVILLEAVAMPSRVKGEGRWLATGIVQEEELSDGMRKMRRRSMASASLENVKTALRGEGLSVDDWDVHIDFPGGMPVDGPSAGVAIAVAIFSAVTRKPVRGDVAMTGEVSIKGEILPVGGVPAKIDAAVQGGASLVLVPRENMQSTFDPMRVQGISALNQALVLAVGERDEENLPLPSAGQEQQLQIASPAQSG